LSGTQFARALHFLSEIDAMWNFRRLSVSTALPLLTLLAFAGDASARAVRIDFEDNNYAASGQAWDPIQFVDVATDLNSGPIGLGLGFSIDFGAGLVDTVFINENGYVSFGAAGVDFVGGITSLTELPAGSNVVAPYYANLQSVNGASDITFVDQSVSYSTGRLSRGDGPFDPTGQDTAPLAMRITWYNLLDSNNDQVQVQALFVQTPGAVGDFDLELNYGPLFSTQIPSTAGFLLNGVSYVVPGALDGSVDYTLSFRNGVFQTGTTPPTNVPTPDALVLMLTGFALLLLRRRTRVVQP
jgi:hypothetical protein